MIIQMKIHMMEADAKKIVLPDAKHESTALPDAKHESTALINHVGLVSKYVIYLHKTNTRLQSVPQVPVDYLFA